MASEMTLADPGSPENEQWIELKKKLWTLYNAGTPLFTKHAIRQLAQQLDDLKPNQSGKLLSLLDMEGNTVPFDVYWGDPIPSISGPNSEKIVGKPRVEYLPIEHLVHIKRAIELTSNAAAVPLSIWHPVIPRVPAINGDQSRLLTTPRQALDCLSATMGDWKNGDHYGRLRDTLSSISIRLTKAIAFACGSLNEDGTPNKRSNFQHSVLLALPSLLGSSGDVRFYAQEPEYTDLDKAALEALGITALEDPKAFLEVDDGSLVLSIAPDIPVKQVVLDISRPAVIIWMDDNYPGGDGLVTDPESSRVRKILAEEYLACEFPEHRDIPNTKIFARRLTAPS